uniref:ATP-dependent RNA helicase n=1 Tax=Oncorhynchus kisutch TaxID=8019 RepID=A0A8C7I8T2_ONCKI
LRKKMGKKNPTDTADPVNNFERWKKKYNKTKTRVKQEKTQKRKPEWQVEKEGIILLGRARRINAKDAESISCLGLTFLLFTPGLMEAQYRQPTEIQRQTIDFALQGKDVLGAAKTGSGKTLAFLIPVSTQLAGLSDLEVLRKVGKNHEFSAGLIIGRKDLKNEKIHRTNNIICTPGRLLQHMDETAAFHAFDLHMLVLDIGFADTINAIVENLPKTRQTLLFSATQTKSLKDLARLSLQDPEYVWVHEKDKFSTPATLEQNYVVCELSKKVNMLFSFIRSHLQKKVIVFFACCKEVQYLLRVYCRLRPGMPILALHGKQQLMKRVEVYNDFIKKKNAVLFATDIAARGLDFPAVNWVLQFHCPEDANTHIHRVGRTARYKEGGEALLVLLPSEEECMLSQLQEKIVPINRIQVNPEKLTSVQQKLEAFLAQEKEQRRGSCFFSYLRSVYLMKNKEVFDVFQLKLQEYAESNTMKKTEKETKFKEAKKVLKRNFQVNTKLVFTEEGHMVQQWPTLQRTAVPATEGEEDDGTTGINVEELEYRRKVKEKHREKRLKEKAARREASKQHTEEQKSEEEVVAYLDGADGEEFDPSTLPDPDKLCSDSEEDDDQSSHAAGMRKRSLSDCSDDSGEEDEAEGSRKRPRQQAAAKPLDTGLSLAEDEELVLHLLGIRR